jgi:hypothetical protein
VTREEFRERWERRRAELAEVDASVNAARLLDSVLADAEAVFGSEASESLTLRDAARESGYSRDHLARLVRSGAISNAGRPNAPRIRRANLPRKAGALQAGGSTPQLVSADPEQIARSVVTSATRGTR